MSPPGQQGAFWFRSDFNRYSRQSNISAFKPRPSACTAAVSRISTAF